MGEKETAEDAVLLNTAGNEADDILVRAQKGVPVSDLFEGRGGEMKVLDLSSLIIGLETFLQDLENSEEQVDKALLKIRIDIISKKLKISDIKESDKVQLEVLLEKFKQLKTSD